MINFTKELPQNTTVVQFEHSGAVFRSSYDSAIYAVDNNNIWGMSGTISGAYCQQWTTMDDNPQCYMHL